MKLFGVLLAAGLACALLGAAAAHGCTEMSELNKKLGDCLESLEQTAFLDCMNQNSSCACLETSASFKACLGDCALVMHSVCDGYETPAPPVWKPSASQFLKYSGHKPTLDHVDGVYVINLKRRPDRLQKFLESSGLRDGDVHVFPAIDGRALKLTKDIKALFGNCDYKYHRGYISATLSHYALWRHIASTTGEHHLVFEDDAIFPTDFTARWNRDFAPALPHNSQLVYLGGMLAGNFWNYKSGEVLAPVNDRFARHKASRFFAFEVLEGVDNFTKGAPTHRYFYTSIAYMISSNAARSLVQFIEKYGFRRAADHTLYRVLEWAPHDSYATTPLLITLPPGRMDTDVNHESNMLDDKCAQSDSCDAEDLPPTKATNQINGLGDVPTYVITTPNQPDRSQLLHSSAATAGVGYTPLVGVDGADLDVEAFRARDVLGPAFPLKGKGTAAVALSHIMAMEQLLDDETAQAYLILEDDVTLPKDFLARVDKAVAALPAGWHILNLGCTGCDGTQAAPGLIAPAKTCVSGLRGYLVSKAGAQTIIETALPLPAALDRAIRIAYGTTLRAYCASPAIVAHNDNVPQLRAVFDQ